MLILPETLTLAQARDTLHMLSQALQPMLKGTDQPQIIVQAVGLVHFDSSALAVLLECQRLAQAWGKGFWVRQAPPKLMALARLYGLDALLVFENAPA